MRPSLRQVFDQLVSEGKLAPEDERRVRSALAQQEQGTPWFVKAMIGGGAWVATLLFLVFLGLFGAFNSAGALIVFGAVMLGAAALLRRVGEGAFPVQCALALSLVGQGCLVIAVVEGGGGEIAAAAVLLVISCAWIVVFPDGVHRFLSTIAAAGSVLFLLYKVQLDVAISLGYAIIAAALVAAWLLPVRIEGRWSELRSPVGHGLAVSVLLAILPDSIGVREAGHALVGSAILALTVVVVELRVLRQVRGRLDAVAWGTVVGTLLVAAMTAQVPGLLAALVVMLLGVHRREPLLLGEGVVAFVFFVGWYYYALELTLLQKSIALVVSGGVLLAGAWFLSLRHPPARPAPAGPSLPEAAP